MKIAFLDPIDWDYSVESPLKEPMGGSQSALCYLAVELAKRGHVVSLVNQISRPGAYLGVDCVAWAQGANAAFLNQVDVLIVLNTALGAKIRAIGVRTPMVLWSQHAHDQPAIAGLAQVEEQTAWNWFVFVSRWQRANYGAQFGVPAECSRVLNSCVAPVFAATTPREPWFLDGRPPILAYTSTPYRGLDVLLDAFPLIRAQFPAVELRVYSSMDVYKVPREKDEYAVLYQRCAQIEGVRYIGSLPQGRLAQEMTDIAALAYPSTFAETFCIAAAEAASLGAALLTTRLGALPELFGEFARMVDPQPDKKSLASEFAAMTVATLATQQRDSAAAAAQRVAQIDACRRRFAWPQRAIEWERFLGEVLVNAMLSGGTKPR
jgi:glycosyltransferase involved in cell wall biosynthesis